MCSRTCAALSAGISELNWDAIAKHLGRGKRSVQRKYDNLKGSLSHGPPGGWKGEVALRRVAPYGGAVHDAARGGIAGGFPPAPAPPARAAQALFLLGSCPLAVARGLASRARQSQPALAPPGPGSP